MTPEVPVGYGSGRPAGCESTICEGDVAEANLEGVLVELLL